MAAQRQHQVIPPAQFVGEAAGDRPFQIAGVVLIAVSPVELIGEVGLQRILQDAPQRKGAPQRQLRVQRAIGAAEDVGILILPFLAGGQRQGAAPGELSVQRRAGAFMHG